MDDLIKEIEKLDIGKVDKNVEIAKHTTYKVGGEAKAFVYPKDVKSLVKLIRFLKANDIKYKVLGSGSNVLFSDKEYDGVIIKLSQFDDIEFLSNNRIRVGAGYSLIKLAYLTAKKSLTGLEFAAGIPGTVGGAVFMNAGAYDGAISYVIKEAEVIDDKGNIINIGCDELELGYRTSIVMKKGYVVVSATFTLEKGEHQKIEDRVNDLTKRREEKQPLEYPSAGSTFKRPEGHFTGKLIQEAGLKGFCIGGAAVSKKHSGFVINKGGATAKDVLDVIKHVQDTVREKFNVELQTEVRIVGED